MHIAAAAAPPFLLHLPSLTCNLPTLRRRWRWKRLHGPILRLPKITSKGRSFHRSSGALFIAARVTRKVKEKWGGKKEGREGGGAVVVAPRPCARLASSPCLVTPKIREQGWRQWRQLNVSSDLQK